MFMTLEVADLFHINRLTDSAISHLSDNVVLLQFLRGRSRVQRAMSVLKTRASMHEPVIREFAITGDGIVLGDAFEGDQDLS